MSVKDLIVQLGKMPLHMEVVYDNGTGFKPIGHVRFSKSIGMVVVEEKEEAFSKDGTLG